MTNPLLPILLRALSRTLVIIFLCVGILASDLMATSASAQQVLAAVITADLPRYQQVHKAMVKVLQAGGFGEDKVKIFTQSPNADKMSLTNSLRRAEAAGAAVVIAYGSQSTALAQGELKNTQLLFADVYDPVALGTVKTLEAPGTAASGATSKTDMGLLVNSLVAIKAVKSVGVLYTKGEKGSEQQLDELREQGKIFGFSVSAENTRNPGEATKLGAKLAAETEALFLTESVSVALQAKEIANSAQAAKCITFSQIPGLVDEGALLGMEADLEEQGKLVAVHALQVLQGQKVHLLPVREAKKITLKINKQAAEQLGLAIPPAVASKAKLL